jgi:Fe-Mn family superoxide dismutase
MAFTLPDLPFAKDALKPHISPETLEYHHGKHHQTYVNKLNDLVKDSQWESQSLEEIIQSAEGGIFQNGAQVWNHSFYWSCLRPPGGGDPPRPLADALKKQFGDVKRFQEAFTKAAATHFGSGWAWLVKEANGELGLLSTNNADNPLREGKTPLLTCDVWEHAYYIDYRNARPQYIEAFWNLVNWDFVAENLAR